MQKARLLDDKPDARKYKAVKVGGKIVKIRPAKKNKEVTTTK